MIKLEVEKCVGSKFCMERDRESTKPWKWLFFWGSNEWLKKLVRKLVQQFVGLWSMLKYEQKSSIKTLVYASAQHVIIHTICMLVSYD